MRVAYVFFSGRTALLATHERNSAILHADAEDLKSLSGYALVEIAHLPASTFSRDSGYIPASSQKKLVSMALI